MGFWGFGGIHLVDFLKMGELFEQFLFFCVEKVLCSYHQESFENCIWGLGPKWSNSDVVLLLSLYWLLTLVLLGHSFVVLESPWSDCKKLNLICITK